jgi:hypothetical protein
MQLCFRIAKPVLALIVLAAGSVAQVAPANQINNAPERAYLSSEKYANAFFGFAISLPPATHFAVVTSASKPPNHFLFGLKARQSQLTGINIVAKQTAEPSTDAIKDAISREDSHTKKIKIDGKEFWRSESKLETAFGKQEFIGYGAAVKGYIVEFQIVSVDPELTAELERMVQSLIFFDPAKSQETAGAGSRPYPIDTAAIEAASAKIAELDGGSVAGNTYSNSYFGFSYLFPARWSVADKAARRKITFTEHRPEKNLDLAPDRQIALHCTRVLLWAAKYPQAKSGGEFDPFILVTVADPACLPAPVSFPTSIHDVAGLQEFTQAVIQSFTGTALLGAAKGEALKARAINAGGHLFITFPTVGLTPVPGSRLYKKIHLSMAITELRNYWLMWTFASDSPSELREMMKASIAFAPPATNEHSAR